MQGWLQRKTKEARPSKSEPAKWNLRYYALYQGGAESLGVHLPSVPMLYYFVSIDDCGAFFRAAKRPHSCVAAKGYIKISTVVDVAVVRGTSAAAADELVLTCSHSRRRGRSSRRERTVWTFRVAPECGESAAEWARMILTALAPLQCRRWIAAVALRRWRVEATHARVVRFHVDRTDHHRACALQAWALAGWAAEATERVASRDAARHFRRRRPRRRAALAKALAAWRLEVKVADFRVAARARSAVRRWVSWRRWQRATRRGARLRRRRSLTRWRVATSLAVRERAALAAAQRHHALQQRRRLIERLRGAALASQRRVAAVAAVRRGSRLRRLRCAWGAIATDAAQRGPLQRALSLIGALHLRSAVQRWTSSTAAERGAEAVRAEAAAAARAGEEARGWVLASRKQRSARGGARVERGVEAKVAREALGLSGYHARSSRDAGFGSNFARLHCAAQLRVASALAASAEVRDLLASREVDDVEAVRDYVVEWSASAAFRACTKGAQVVGRWAIWAKREGTKRRRQRSAVAHYRHRATARAWRELKGWVATHRAKALERRVMERMFDGCAAPRTWASHHRALQRARYQKSTVEERRLRASVAAEHYRHCTLRRTFGWWSWAQSNTWVWREADRLDQAATT